MEKSFSQMIAQVRENNNSLVKSSVGLTSKNKNAIRKLSWDDYRSLRGAYKDGTVDFIINCMNGVAPGCGDKFEALFNECMGHGSLKSYIYANYVPVEIPLLVKGVPASYNNIEGNDVVQFNFEGGELEAVVRFIITKDSDVLLQICLWDNHKMGDEESMLYSNVDIDWIDELFSDANELLSAICQSYINMARNV